LYFPAHWYSQPGLYVITVRDSFLVEDIVNIENSGGQILELRDSFRIREGGIPSVIAYFYTSNLDIRTAPSGAIIHNPAYGFPAFTLYDSTAAMLVPFVEEGYEFPPATDTITCCRPLVWDRPVAAGRYAFGLHVQTWYQGELLGTATRKMVIDVDSAMLVSAPDIWPALPPLSLYPNPASEAVYLSFGEPLASPAELRVFSLAGQEAYRAALPGGLAGQAWEIPVAGWPAGVYVVRVIAGGRSWVERVIKR
jgi:hypothetical protein